MPKEEKEEKKVEKKDDRWKHVLLITVLVIALMGVSCAMGYALGGTSIIKKVEEQKEEIIKEQTLTDEEKMDLSRKLDVVLKNFQENTYTSESTIFNSYIFRANVLKGNVTAADKQYILLKSLTYNKLDGSHWEEIDQIKTWVQNDSTAKDEFGVLDFDTVNKEYRKLFGEDLEPVEEVGKCPSILYHASTKEFYKFPARCGGTSGVMVTMYKEKYELSGDEAYLYFRVGFVAPMENDYSKFYVYRDFDTVDGTFLRNVIDMVEEVPSSYDYKITKENADKFIQYKATFKKDSDGNYFFVNVQKV